MAEQEEFGEIREDTLVTLKIVASIIVVMVLVAISNLYFRSFHTETWKLGDVHDISVISLEEKGNKCILNYIDEASSMERNIAFDTKKLDSDIIDELYCLDRGERVKMAIIGYDGDTLDDSSKIYLKIDIQD